VSTIKQVLCYRLRSTPGHIWKQSNCSAFGPFSVPVRIDDLSEHFASGLAEQNIRVEMRLLWLRVDLHKSEEVSERITDL
jgi:hypothetical protein